MKNIKCTVWLGEENYDKDRTEKDGIVWNKIGLYRITLSLTGWIKL